MNRHPKVQTISQQASTEIIVRTCQQKKPSLVMVGPEQPIVNGIADILRDHGFAVCAPGAQAAQLEGSKIFSKEFMAEFDIPTAKSISCGSYEEAQRALARWDFNDGIVIKSDALAGGKGVVLCDTQEQAQKVIHQFMVDPNIKVKTERILFEERLHGKEVSAFALLDASGFVELGYACDYKRAFDGDKGPNTGGMGTYTPQDWPKKHHREQIQSIFSKVHHGMSKRNHPYIGVLFAGLMIDEHDVNVIEFNIRFGDPETQVLMPTIERDLFPLLFSAAQGTLSEQQAAVQEKYAVHVVLASQGYPSIGEHPVSTGLPITIPSTDDLFFYAGVQEEQDTLYTSGGRVMGCTGVGASIAEARAKAYSGVRKISFDGMHYRSDIGENP